MPKRVVYAPEIAIPVKAYSQAIDTGSLVFCSGQLAYDAKNDAVFSESAAEQTDYLMQNIQVILDAAGLQWQDVVKTTIFLTDMNDFVSVNEVYARYFDLDPPARSTIGVNALAKGAKVEIEVIASRT
ncbi:reactive intermediate/imine deaminase [Chroococcidiopsis sp. CCALA 051]|uniref:Rid family detoxifying hydrolase n=1 Tax=Chroococcidiopsis sp. CCALA 051 TaxID=869949 RepID=UPI000D0D52B0|nr:Rid family detoxifying hydrolase [Chroococcidiopsis sp. CCALA 051]MBE9017697.1 reactive intermediate/imine deaminase [Chroococcidiopsidales cyanobacterium LEGE 13417]PSM46977.1 reactive intermediate/imine deaminase [Chroococcidiopsis sp. CCALA 051]